MVYLNRIYTKSGDAGQTSLGNDTRVAKTDRRIIAYGGIDELNSFIGLAIAADVGEKPSKWLRHVQNDLFDLGADLCVPESKNSGGTPLRATAEQVETLERWIDEITESLSPLTSFVLPGGSPAAAHLHVARAVCRRVEIGVLELAAREQINPHVAVYLNRLSDLLFVLARDCNDGGRADVLWVPGGDARAAK